MGSPNLGNSMLSGAFSIAPCGENAGGTLPTAFRCEERKSVHVKLSDSMTANDLGVCSNSTALGAGPTKRSKRRTHSSVRPCFRASHLAIAI